MDANRFDSLARALDPCAGKNWCMDRTHTCGPAGQDYRCWVTTFGGNVCGLSTATSNVCFGRYENEVCVLAAGGGDHCASPSGQDFRYVTL
ncbi:MAG: hypothetical protein H0V00_14475 [Chloroflexia bacterium]|nr:hypothetical protein [Chloroflexia bacterium]